MRADGQQLRTAATQIDACEPLPAGDSTLRQIQPNPGPGNAQSTDLREFFEWEVEARVHGARIELLHDPCIALKIALQSRATAQRLTTSVSPLPHRPTQLRCSRSEQAYRAAAGLETVLAHHRGLRGDRQHDPTTAMGIWVDNNSIRRTPAMMLRTADSVTGIYNVLWCWSLRRFCRRSRRVNPLDRCRQFAWNQTTVRPLGREKLAAAFVARRVAVRSRQKVLSMIRAFTSTAS